eukprot:SAG31_NODE_2364_length_5860_cov_11.314529_1_plen_92_part_10
MCRGCSYILGSNINSIFIVLILRTTISSLNLAIAQATHDQTEDGARDATADVPVAQPIYPDTRVRTLTYLNLYLIMFKNFRCPGKPVSRWT